MHQTLEQIRHEGLIALREHLGPTGMIRFLQQFEVGAGNYAVDRHHWVDTTSLEDLKKLSAKRRQPRR